MNQWVKDTALRKWGDDIDMIKLCDLMDKRGQRVCVVGVLLKAMKLQPSILREVSEDLELVCFISRMTCPLMMVIHHFYDCRYQKHPVIDTHKIQTP